MLCCRVGKFGLVRLDKEGLATALRGFVELRAEQKKNMGVADTRLGRGQTSVLWLCHGELFTEKGCN